MAPVVLVTGGTGLIGARTVRELARRGAGVVVYDRAPRAERLGDLAGAVAIEAGDVADGESLARALARHRVTEVIHLGAILSLEAVRNPVAAVRANSVGTATVFESALAHGVRRVVWASTTGLYGTRRQYERLLGRHTVDEDDPPMPPNLYTATKQLNEVLARTYRARGLDAVGLRPVLTYGDTGGAGAFETAAGIVNRALRDLALTGAARVTDPWARDSRINVMHADDCASLFAELCLVERPPARDVYNAGTGEYASVGEMLATAAGIAGGGTVEFESESVDGTSAVGIPIYDFPDVDSTRVRTELGWRPRYDFAAGARAVMDQSRRTPPSTGMPTPVM